jgi:hypothetical protein
MHKKIRASVAKTHMAIKQYIGVLSSSAALISSAFPSFFAFSMFISLSFPA